MLKKVGKADGKLVQALGLANESPVIRGECSSSGLKVCTSQYYGKRCRLTI